MDLSEHEKLELDTLGTNMLQKTLKTYVPIDLLIKKCEAGITYRQLANFTKMCHVKLYRLLTKKHRTTIATLNRLRHAIVACVQACQKIRNDNNLKELKNRTGLSYRQIADVLKLSPNNVYRLISGITCPSMREFIKIKSDLYVLTIGAIGTPLIRR